MTTQDQDDARRYRALKKHCLRIVPADRDGPQYPQLVLSWDMWNKHPEISPLDGVDAAVDAMDASHGN